MKKLNVVIFVARRYCFIYILTSFFFFNRVGVANFVTLLVQKVGPDIKPYTNMLLRLLFPVVKEETSVAAKRAFAAACAVVMKFSAQSQVQKLVEDSTSLHTGDRNDQISCALLLKSFSSMASDIISGHLVAVIPVIFVSRFEGNFFLVDWLNINLGFCFSRCFIDSYPYKHSITLLCESIRIPDQKDEQL